METITDQMQDSESPKTEKQWHEALHALSQEKITERQSIATFDLPTMPTTSD